MSLTLLATDDFPKVLDELPIGVRIVAELSADIGQSDRSLDQFTSLLKRDATLVTGIIATANTAGYVGAEPIATLDEALARLGLRETFRVAGAVAAAELTSREITLYPIVPHPFRNHVIFTACLMEQLAANTAVDGWLAFTTGLLRPLGKVLLDRAITRTASVSFDLAGVGSLAEWESEMFGYTSNDLSVALVESWSLPQEMADAIRDHYEPPIEASKTAFLLNIAAAIAHERGHGFPGEGDYWRLRSAQVAAIHLDDDAINAATASAQTVFDRLTTALDAAASRHP